jgi:SHS2 domain-containing protein
MSDFEVLAHTADVGLRARGATLEETFEAATHGLASILGAWSPGPGDTFTIAIEPGDLGAQLVDWLSEVLYLHDSRDALIAGVEVAHAGEDGTTGSIVLASRGATVFEGTAVKAITYHQLRVERSDNGWVAELFVDV